MIDITGTCHLLSGVSILFNKLLINEAINLSTRVQLCNHTVYEAYEIRCLR